MEWFLNLGTNADELIPSWQYSFNYGYGYRILPWYLKVADIKIYVSRNF